MVFKAGGHLANRSLGTWEPFLPSPIRIWIHLLYNMGCLDLHRGLRRAAGSVIVQLQTGKIALAGYLGNRTRLLGQFRTPPPSYRVSASGSWDLNSPAVWHP